MDKAMAETYGRVIPGHGPPDEAWPAGALPQHRYLKALLDETRAAIAKGMYIEDAKSTVAVGELADWQVSERAHRVNVSRAYQELEWE